MSKTLSVNIDVNLEAMVDAISDAANHDELVEFVKRLDEAQEDWSFTLRLAEYFESEKAKYEKELSADVDALIVRTDAQ